LAAVAFLLKRRAKRRSLEDTSSRHSLGDRAVGSQLVNTGVGDEEAGEGGGKKPESNLPPPPLPPRHQAKQRESSSSVDGVMASNPLYAGSYSETLGVGSPKTVGKPAADGPFWSRNL
jgi:hypothetical protein